MKIDKKYETGVYWQDVQHGQMIDFYKQVLSRPSIARDPAMFSYSIGFLVMYADQHFKLEEAYMEKYNYPDTDTHTRHHREFIRELKAFKKKYTSYSDEAVSVLESKVGAWIKTHILENDQKLGAYLIRRQKEELLKS
ncbi:MAG: hypothetical protein D3926_02315 [Desulfobacteraceae bacterium]|nr:MAG: hypothetical protein D3926_02315 [Desulfobacteraceae bacterium]